MVQACKLNIWQYQIILLTSTDRLEHQLSMQGKWKIPIPKEMLAMAEFAINPEDEESKKFDT